jgi:superoxide reductase
MKEMSRQKVVQYAALQRINLKRLVTNREVINLADIKDIVQSADWKEEKHVPVIEIPGTVKKDEVVRLNVSVGKEIAHPNTTEHHIEWLALYFVAEGEKFPYLIGRFEFTAHGASTEGPNTSTIYSQPDGVCSFKTGKPGTLLAVSSCNIHGLWTSSVELKVE